MASFNPFLVDEIVTQAQRSSGKNESYFGLIVGSDSHNPELHGFEITMSGKLTLPELHPQKETDVKKAAKC